MLVPAAAFLDKLERGTWIIYVVGAAAVGLAISLTIAGGFTVAPALATVPLAASFDRTGRLSWVRAPIAVALLLLSCVLYVWIFVEYG